MSWLEVEEFLGKVVSDEEVHLGNITIDGNIVDRDECEADNIGLNPEEGVGGVELHIRTFEMESDVHSDIGFGPVTEPRNVSRIVSHLQLHRFSDCRIHVLVKLRRHEGVGGAGVDQNVALKRIVTVIIVIITEIESVISDADSFELKVVIGLGTVCEQRRRQHIRARKHRVVTEHHFAGRSVRAGGRR